MPPVPGAGVPERLPPLDSVTPEGKALAVVQVKVPGLPLAVQANELLTPAMNVALLALVTAGAWPTVSVKLCVAAAPTPLLAVTVNA